MKIKLQIGKVDTNNSKTVGFRIMNPYNSNTLRIQHIKFYLKNNNLFKSNILINDKCTIIYKYIFIKK